MKLVVYKENDGNIYRIDELSSRIEDADSAIADFNTRHSGKSTAELMDAPEGSPLEWLYKNQKLKIKDFRNELLDIQETLNDLYGHLDWIEERFKEVESSHDEK